MKIYEEERECLTERDRVRGEEEDDRRKKKGGGREVFLSFEK